MLFVHVLEDIPGTDDLFFADRAPICVDYGRCEVSSHHFSSFFRVPGHFLAHNAALGLVFMDEHASSLRIRGISQALIGIASAIREIFALSMSSRSFISDGSSQFMQPCDRAVEIVEPHAGMILDILPLVIIRAFDYTELLAIRPAFAGQLCFKEFDLHDSLE